MRGALVVAVVVALGVAAACAPDIAPGTYLCGPERSCPEGQACNGPDNVCVLPSAVLPFTCGDDNTETEPNDDFPSAQPILAGNLACVSRVAEVIGCSQDTDGEDWFGLTIPAICTAVAVEARISFTLAFEQLALELHDAAGAVVATGTSCGRGVPADGDDQRCLDAAVVPGESYAVRVARSGDGDCGGQCAHNRYTLTLQLTAP